MKCFCLAVFIISSIVHLYASKKCNKKLRAWTKGFILPGLIGWYVLSAAQPSVILIAALITSWLGDVLLIPKGTKWFAAGGISFLVSHICFVFAYLPGVVFAEVSVWAVLPVAAVYVVVACLVMNLLKNDLKGVLFYAMFVYLLINATMNCFAFCRLLTTPCFATVLTFIGAILFFTSDSILFQVRFKKDSRFRTHFPVMLSYILSELLIVAGFLIR